MIFFYCNTFLWWYAIPVLIFLSLTFLPLPNSDGIMTFLLFPDIVPRKVQKPSSAFKRAGAHLLGGSPGVPQPVNHGQQPVCGRGRRLGGREDGKHQVHPPPSRAQPDREQEQRRQGTTHDGHCGKTGKGADAVI